MSLFLDEVFTGSIVAAVVGLVLMAAAVAALWWLALRDRAQSRRPVVKPTMAAPPRIFDDAAVWHHRRQSRPRSVRQVVRHPVDDRTQVIPALSDATELIPRYHDEAIR